MMMAAEHGRVKGDIKEGKQMQITAEGRVLSSPGLFNRFIKHAD